ncbi:2OG-Fe(II) oxygenase [Alteromonas stellipolaris]|uniref:2OG-Fe(II) oxygenase n=1 Tax=Alteromonas stellipolaris TaxID=233316 RepID=UPI002494AA4E|nr:2OG-Fe(II) oxygenase family protein [Alteromonas stellipolaris]
MTEAMNNSLDREAIKKEFNRKRKIRVKNFLDVDYASNLLLSLNNKVKFEMALVRNGAYDSITETAWRNMEMDARKKVNDEVMSNASQGIGFVYGRHLVTPKESDPTMLRFHEWLNSDSMLQWARDLSGFEDISSASVQATRYTPGQFLTRHQDVVEREGRRLAYVINLAPKWHPDWGGLLQFFEPDGTTTDAWSPEFNTLSLFDVKHIHSVTYVTPFAKQPRYALTGWFKAK